MTEYFAHTTDGGKETWQPLITHLKSVADLASERATVFGAEGFGYWAGLMHDIGKFSGAFQRYLETSKGRVDHSTAGAQLIRRLWRERGGKNEEIFSTLLSYVIAGHHGGLPDGGSTSADLGSLLARLGKPDIPSFDAWQGEVELSEIPQFPKLKCNKKTAAFTLSFFVRMIYSCLTDADFLDTEAFCDGEKAAHRGQWPNIETLADTLKVSIEEMLKEAKETPVNKARLEILGHCRDAAPQKPGVFSLTVPTGGGKTLSSLSFALEHARTHGLRRIIYVIPYTSIIEQNADVFRKALGDDAVLEHHCNYVHPDEEKAGGDEYRDSYEAKRFRMATENWEATLVVTTAVQFFESLFANRSSRCRKLHSIAGSVVILDEAQMLPLPLLQPSVMALRELTNNYGATLVLCTATQPALEKFGALTCGFPEGVIREIIPLDRKEPIFSVFARTKVMNLGTLSDAELSEKIQAERQVLCIVNTRNHARQVFDAMGKGDGHYHLSARMYPAHRRAVLKKIRERLDNNLSCRVVSTSLIECGVDVDFPTVFRAVAGLDSIAQAAGRCNREGRLELGSVYVFKPETGMPKRAPGFQRRAEVYGMVAEEHDDLFSPEAVASFFTKLYQFEELDQKNIMELLIDANKGTAFPTSFPFCEINTLYRFIENDMVSVIVEGDETARHLVSQLEYADEISGILRKLQAYTVQVYKTELDKLFEGGVVPVRGQFYIARQGIGYRDDVGLCSDDPTYWQAGSGIF
ncbi:CRISPR-associated helicase Cas3' [Desulfoluna sp.]|uniref:CRISPR-associated helicase Cas3' n=1 Tax=Desulfoluna sp. TaxID=2045199 RepID=UPI002615BDC3|nr:CRISPR-associated helicase Cas3' [Desulfoluna sp.]